MYLVTKYIRNASNALEKELKVLLHANYFEFIKLSYEKYEKIQSNESKTQQPQ